MTTLIHNLKTAGPTKILIPYISSLNNLLYDACIIFQKDVDNFEIEHKTCYLGVQFPLREAIFYYQVFPNLAFNLTLYCVNLITCIFQKGNIQLCWSKNYNHKSQPKKGIFTIHLQKTSVLRNWEAIFGSMHTAKHRNNFHAFCLFKKL